ncbi:glycosyltransferase family 2 protein [Thiocapsa roseopersicina]|uniref:Glycosyl transferase family 2 n=1 Tax=Thiocapsa roseopersicina TaxID=1058 RepID=A0A1H2V1B9_THIRO|nr:glycosyltransferase family 2 protein [Thiocapsa roseopersicina]SDW62132.1 Glycosyl transferase family 2 [Thiocapsa roseopersicina]
MKPHEATQSLPLISAIVRVSDSSDAVSPSLEALRAQSLDVGRFEVLVVDDGCTDEMWTGIEATSSALHFQCARWKGGGIAGWRNLGLSLARSPIVLFIEEGEVLDPACLEEHYRAHEEHPQSHFAVLGYTGLRGEAERSPLMRYLAEAERRDICCVDSLESCAGDGPGFGCRLPSFKRLYLLDHGGFNPVFPVGTEARELGIRLSRAGLCVARSAGAESVVIRPCSLEEVCTYCYLQGRADWLLARLYPEQDAVTWARLDSVESEWMAIAPLFPSVMKSARELDRFARERCRADLPLDDLTTRLLHRAYAAALRANRIRGVFGAMSEARLDSTPPSLPCTEA